MKIEIVLQEENNLRFQEFYTFINENLKNIFLG